MERLIEIRIQMNKAHDLLVKIASDVTKFDEVDIELKERFPVYRLALVNQFNITKAIYKNWSNKYDNELEKIYSPIDLGFFSREASNNIER